MKIIKRIAMFVLSFMIAFTAIMGSSQVSAKNASAPNLDKQMVNWGGMNYDISNYHERIGYGLNLSKMSASVIRANVTKDDNIRSICFSNHFTSPFNLVNIGEEYGYYINTSFMVNPTTGKRLRSTSSTVLLFDVNHKEENYGSKVTDSINVIGQYRYATIYKENVQWNGSTWVFTYKENNEEVMYCGTGTDFPYTVAVPKIVRGIMCYKEVTDFSIGQATIATTMSNLNTANSGDSGYNVKVDNGRFYIGADYCYSGTKLNVVPAKAFNFSSSKLNSQLINSAFSYAFDNIVSSNMFSKGAQIAVDCIGLAADIVKALSSDSKGGKVSYNEVPINKPNSFVSYCTTKDDQIKMYGGLMRSSFNSVGSTDKNKGAILCRNNGDHVTFLSLSSKTDKPNSKSIPCRIRTKLGVSILDSKYNQANNGFVEYAHDYGTGNNGITITDSKSVTTIIDQESFALLNFTPSRTGYYSLAPSSISSFNMVTVVLMDANGKVLYSSTNNNGQTVLRVMLNRRQKYFIMYYKYPLNESHRVSLKMNYCGLLMPKDL